MKYRIDGRMIERRTALEIVERMHEQSFSQYKNTEAFMKGVSRRTKTQNGQTVRTDSARNFLNDLVRARMISRRG